MRHAATRARWRERWIVSAGRHAVLLLACAVTFVPIVFLALSSFKSLEEFFRHPYGLPPVWRTGNYAQAWTEAQIATTLLNSTLATAGGVLLNLALTVPASYALARLRFRFRPLVYLGFVGGMVVPLQLILLPLLLTIARLQLSGSRLSLVLAYAALTIPMSVLFLTSFIGTLPASIEEAARVDGAGTGRIIWSIVLPLTRPGLAAVAILTGVWIWNDFIVALILATRPSLQTLPVGIMSFFGVYSTEWTLAFASVCIAAVPLLGAYLFMTRQFIAGLTSGALKG
jgi:raffinose/stachyose/melibiose transport system permease protein